MEHLTAFLTRMPKVELHVHLESTMPGEMLARFAARQGRELPRPAERLYDCSAEDLSDFLAFLDNICSFVGTPEELAEAAEHAALESGREHILYSEMILNPTHWPQFSVPEIIAAVTAGFDRAAAQGGADCRFTLSLSRTQTGAEAMALVEAVKPRIVIPMHYRSDTFGYDVIGTLDEFTNLCDCVVEYAGNSIELNGEMLQQVAVLKLK